MLTTELVERVSDGLSDAKGRECKYFKLNENEGLKTWKSEWRRDRSYDMQARCYEVGLAPRLGKKLEIETLGGEILFGYVTEHLPVLTEETNKLRGTPEFYTVCEEFNEAAQTLQAVYLENGIYFEDSCLFNIGRMENGELCAIDFGDIYCEGEDCPDYDSDSF